MASFVPHTTAAGVKTEEQQEAAASLESAAAAAAELAAEPAQLILSCQQLSTSHPFNPFEHDAKAAAQLDLDVGYRYAREQADADAQLRLDEEAWRDSIIQLAMFKEAQRDTQATDGEEMVWVKTDRAASCAKSPQRPAGLRMPAIGFMA